MRIHRYTYLYRIGNFKINVSFFTASLCRAPRMGSCHWLDD